MPASHRAECHEPSDAAPTSPDTADAGLDDGRERGFEAYGFAVSLLVHTVVLLGLALIVRVDGAREVAVAIISTTVVNAPLEELDFEPLEAVEIPEEVETATVDPGPVASDDEFAVIFFNDGPLVRSALTLERATDGAKKGYLEWIDSVQPSGGTDPSEALAEALRLKPSVIFLLTDGQFESASTLNVIKKFNRYRRVRIHAIALGPHADVEILRQIATKNRGELKAVRH